MILFEKIRWKNLLSTGNHFTEVELNKDSTTLIIKLTEQVKYHSGCFFVLSSMESIS